MPARSDTALVVRGALAELWPGRFDERRLREEVSLGEGGLGLDSIEIVELVLTSAEGVGVPAYDADELLDRGPITLGGLIDHLATT